MRPLRRAKFPDPAPGAEVENLIGVDGPGAVAAVPPVAGGEFVTFDVRALLRARRAAMKQPHTLYGAAGRDSVSGRTLIGTVMLVPNPAPTEALGAFPGGTVGQHEIRNPPAWIRDRRFRAWRRLRPAPFRCNPSTVEHRGGSRRTS